MSKIRIAFAINDAYTQPLNIAIYSLLKNNPNNNFHIYVLCNSLTLRNQESIRNILKYYSNAKIEVIELKDHTKRFKHFELNIDYISIETYYRYLLAELLPDVDKVIYLDADLFITDDVSALYDTDIHNYYAAGVNDSYINDIDENGNISNNPNYKKMIGFKQEELYINAGVIVMNLKKIRTDKITSVLFENTVKWSKKIRFQDQDIINITMKGKIKELPNSFNYTDHDKIHDKKDATELNIIHCNGVNKPWKNATFADFQLPYVKLYRRYVDEYNILLYGTTNKFAIFTFSTENIGDDIQAIAARRFLPRVDYEINRDKVGGWCNTDANEQVKLITNSWYMHHPHEWPIVDPTIDPLYISMYLEQASRESADRFLSSLSRKKFKDFGKIGARDKSTHDFFVKNGIDSYLSGCMTLTLQRDERIKKSDFILLTDVSKDIYEYVKNSTKRKVIYITNAINSYDSAPSERYNLAEMYLYLYQSAHCVITERLHTALPCLALETPVVLIKKNVPVGGNKNRFAGLGSLAHYYTEKEFLSENVFDINKPSDNPKAYLKLRESLISVTEQFTNFNNTKTFAWSDIPERPLQHVLDELDFIITSKLKDASSGLVQKKYELDSLNETLERDRVVIEALNIEIDKMMGVKKSARRLAGNLRRKIGRSYEGE